MKVDLPRTAGIYMLESPSGKQYIGSSLNMHRRCVQHRIRLNAGTHHAPALQAAWRKYGADSFTCRVLEAVEDIAQLHAREQWHLDQRRARTKNNGYNTMPSPTRAGYRQPPTPALLAYWERMRGRQATPEQLEALARTRAAMDMEKRAQAVREGNARGWKERGGKMTARHQRALEQTSALPRKPLNDCQRAALDAGRRLGPEGMKTPEARARQAAYMRGKKLSPETRAKMSASQRARQARAKTPDGMLPLW